MKIKLLTITLVLGLAFALGAGNVAAAPPGMPNAFYGSVTIDGTPAIDDITVTAHIGDLSWSTTTSGGQYGYSPQFIIPLNDPATPQKDGGVNGDEIIFKVNGTLATTDPASPILFETGGVDQVDLSIGEISLMPVAAFSASPLSGDEPLTVVFTDESQNMINNPTWSWEFGDGGTSTEASPTHQYLEAGSYTVTLTATTDDGTDSEVKVNYITVIAEDGFDWRDYDADGDGDISKGEAQDAVDDYADGAGPLSKTNALEVVKLYFS